MRKAVVDCGALSKDAGTCIKENYYLTDEVVDDETSDNNLRYIGADPENYIWFNDELWRIIGVMNNIDDGSGTKETRLKIIKNESIGEYSWDNKGANGENDWSTSALQTLLNSGAYYNRTSGECPYGGNGATTPCDFSTTGLTEETKLMIDNAVWNLGGSDTSDNVTTAMFYERERGDTVYNERPTEWIGQIGLMYPSDYGYATSGGVTTNRSTCLINGLYNWHLFEDCINNNWLYVNQAQWTLTPLVTSSNHVFRRYASGHIYYALGSVSKTDMAVVPVTYLSSNIKITSGSGTKELPYVLSL